MAKKDFSGVGNNVVRTVIAEATAAQEEPKTQITQEKKQKRKPRKTYSEHETAEILESMQTTGKKGCKLPRINLALTPTNRKYVTIMARVSGMNMTEFVNKLVDTHREDHADQYKQALAFRDSL